MTLSRRAFGLHSSRGRSRTRTLAAQLASSTSTADNPFPQGDGVPLVLIAGALPGGSTGFTIAVGALFVLAILSGNAASQDPRYREWSSTFRCNRCGTVFLVTEASEATDQEVPRMDSPR